MRLTAAKTRIAPDDEAYCRVCLGSAKIAVLACNDGLCLRCRIERETTSHDYDLDPESIRH